MKQMSVLKSWAEIILTFFLPFVFTVWAWGWPWLFINAFLFFLVAIWIGGWEVPDSKFITIILFLSPYPNRSPDKNLRSKSPALVRSTLYIFCYLCSAAVQKALKPIKTNPQEEKMLSEKYSRNLFL